MRVRWRYTHRASPGSPAWRSRTALICARSSSEASTSGLHVDFESALSRFYFDACGFRRTDAEETPVPGTDDLRPWSADVRDREVADGY